MAKVFQPQALPELDRRPQLLCLAPAEPWPAVHGGKEGVHGLVVALAERASVLLCCPGQPASPAALDHYQRHGITYRPVPFEPRDSIAVFVSATAQLKPFKFHKYGTSEAVRAFGEVTADVQPDAIICFHAHMEELGQRLKRRRGWTAPVLVREHNIEYEMVDSLISARPAWQRWLAAPFAWITRRTELAIWARADVTAFLSDRDFATAQAAELGGRGRLVLAAEGVPIPPLRHACRPSSPHSLLMPLNRTAPHSVSNARSFLLDYWLPHANTAALSDVLITVTGVDPAQLQAITGISPEVQQAHRIVASGFLPSLQPAFERALALVAPTFVGAGIRKKILEGMANQVPIVTTQMDIQTCHYFKADDNLLDMGTPDKFVQVVRRMIEDDALWDRLSRRGRETVEAHADWGACADVLLRELAAVSRTSSNGGRRVQWMREST
jgi:glycosyltransferase involved in cell wall biosynthesis